MTTAEIIISERAKRNISQTELANAIGYRNYASIARVEKGEQEISTKMAYKLSDYFDIPYEELVNGNDDPFIYTQEERTRLSNLRKNKKYCSKNYDFYKLRFAKGEKEKIQQFAEEHGYASFNDFIMQAIDNEMNR